MALNTTFNTGLDQHQQVPTQMPQLPTQSPQANPVRRMETPACTKLDKASMMHLKITQSM